MSREYIGKWRVSYCKKLTLVAKLDVTRMLGAQTEVLGRAQAAEFAEIMNEVGLVGITARESDIDPADCGRFRVDRRSNRRFRISDLRCRTRPISKFPTLTGIFTNPRHHVTQSGLRPGSRARKETGAGVRLALSKS